MRDAVIVGAKRTAVGKAKRGALIYTRPEDMAATAIKAVMEATGVDGADVNDLILGCAMPEAEQGMNIARVVALHAGLPQSVPAVTVNRFCSSGLETIAMAATRVMAGLNDIVLAGGVESMSLIPMGGNKIVGHPEIAESDTIEVYCAMGNTAENVVARYGEEYGITREAMDEFGANSNAKAIAAIKAGKFKEEIVPLPYYTWKNGEKIEGTFDTDEGPRETTVETLGKLRPAFKVKGSVTAGNSSQMSDGAAIVMIMSREEAEKRGLEILGIFRDYQVAGCKPDEMGVGPAYAIPKLVDHAGIKVDDVDVFEVNEAFASQAIYSLKKVGIPFEKANPNGGAIALGHPLGCTGAKLTVQLLHEMKREGHKRGIVSMCIGGGMGAAGLFERP